MSERVSKAMIRAETYRDSGALMVLVQRLEEVPGVTRVAAIMATPRNLEMLRKMGLAPAAWPSPPRPSDLLVVCEGRSEAACDEALGRVESLVQPRREARAAVDPLGVPVSPRTLRDALDAMPSARLVSISVPGPFAAREARRAVDRGVDVFLFSNGVSLDDEVSLKTAAAEKSVLVMGPDAGSALWSGVPLGFANAVRRGGVGVVGAAGAGVQAVTCLVHQRGGGVSHAMSVGERDLVAEVGGRAALVALDRLSRDGATRVIVLVAHTADPAALAAVLDRAVATGRPVIAALIGITAPEPRAGVEYASTLDEAADRAVQLERAQELRPERATSRQRALVPPRYAQGQRWLRGLYTGNTLAREAAALLRGKIELATNLPLDGVTRTSRFRHAGHHLLYLGDSEYTQGRPHPMIDPSLRVEAIRAAARDPELAVLLLDVVLGANAHPNPAGAMVEAIQHLRSECERAGRVVPVIASVVGTDDDPQRRRRQVEALRAAGVDLCDSNASAVRRAAALLPEGVVAR